VWRKCSNGFVATSGDMIASGSGSLVVVVLALDVFGNHTSRVGGRFIRQWGAQWGSLWTFAVEQ
jgi:hypothetical protein